MKKLLLIILLIYCTSFVYGISQEPYCYAASDFLVFKYQDHDPELIALYDNTKVYFDVNNDGIWEYQKTLRAYDKYVADTNWELTDGSYIHSDKPIIYNQKLYSSTFSGKTNENYQCIPPINSLENEVILYPVFANNEEWKIISPNSTINILYPNQETITKDIETSTLIKVPSSNSNENILYVNSTKPLLALSNWGFSSKIDIDFIKVLSGNTLIAIISDNTQITYDFNGDGIFDEEEIINRGYKEVDMSAGTRIKSNKKIGVFERSWIHKQDYSPAIPTKSMNDELYVSIRDLGKTYVTGVFNDDTGFKNTTYVINAKENGEFDSVSSNAVKAILTTISGNAARIKADKPITAFYNSSVLRNYYKFQRPMQTIEPYITSFSRKKFLGLNDTAIINVRVLNPTSYDLSDVKITIRYTDDFKNSNIKYYLSTKSLDDDSYTVSLSEKTVTPIDYGAIKEFVVNIPSIPSEEYVNIDYYLTTPEIIGNYLFPSASMEYSSEIWNYN